MPVCGLQLWIFTLVCRGSQALIFHAAFVWWGRRIKYAGLAVGCRHQTIGKHYVARASNIEQFTNGRFLRITNETPLPLASSKTYEIMPMNDGKKYQKHNNLIVLENDLYEPKRRIWSLWRGFVLRPDSIVRSAVLSGPVKDFKMRLVSAFCENHANAQVIDAVSLGAIAASQQGFDVVYPAVGDQLDFIQPAWCKRGGASFVETPRRYVLLAICKKRIFNFKKTYLRLMSFVR